MAKKTAKKAEKEQKLSMWQEFKAFILRGNVVEIAVGLTVGAAFTALVASLVNDVIMPIIGIFLSDGAFDNIFIALDGNSYSSLETAEAAGAAVLKIGVFFSELINFLIIALVIFFIIKAISRMRGEDMMPAK